MRPVVPPPRENPDLLFTDLYTPSRTVANNFAQPSSVLSPRSLGMLGMDTHEPHFGYIHDLGFFEPMDVHDLDMDFDQWSGNQCQRMPMFGAA